MGTTNERLQRQFERWRVGQPAGTGGAALVAAFLQMLPASQSRHAWYALQASLKDEPLDWKMLKAYRKRYTRDEANLKATVLGPQARERWEQAEIDVRTRAAVAALYVMRRGEVPYLKRRDLDLETGRVFVKQGKGGRPGWTALTRSGVAALRAWIEQSNPRPDDWVFPSADRPGRPVSPDTVYRWVNAALRQVGLYVHWRGAHAFRRTFANVFLEERPTEILTLKQAMRHSRLDTTEQYLFLQEDKVASAVGGLKL